MPFGFIGAAASRNYTIYGRNPPATFSYILVVGGGARGNGFSGGGAGGVRVLTNVSTGIVITNPTPTFSFPVTVGGVSGSSSFFGQATTGGSGSTAGSPQNYGGNGQFDPSGVMLVTLGEAMGEEVVGILAQELSQLQASGSIIAERELRGTPYQVQ